MIIFYDNNLSYVDFRKLLRYNFILELFFPKLRKNLFLLNLCVCVLECACVIKSIFKANGYF